LAHDGACARTFATDKTKTTTKEEDRLSIEGSR
jgi:hypothetical protein